MLTFLAMIFVYELQIMDLYSSFGPLGRRKIISNDSGSIVITKDGQLIASSIGFPSESPFPKLIMKDLVAGAESSGDGVITASMLVFYTLKCIDERLAASYNSRARTRLLRVSEVLWSVMSQHQTRIVAAMEEAGLWIRAGDKTNKIANIIRNIVTPSSNSSVAADVVDILTTWLLLSNKNTPSNQDLSILCKKILRNFDALVHVAVGHQRPSTRPFSFTAEAEVLLKGRCRDHSALSFHPQSTSGVEFVCVLHLLPRKQALLAHTVQMASAHNVLNLHTVGYSAVEALAEHLQPPAGTTRVIFCCDSVGDEVIQSLANHRLYLIDCIPPDYLTYIARGSNCAVYLSPEDVLHSAESSKTSWGWFLYLERVIFGTRSEVYFKLCGVEKNTTEDRQEEERGGEQRGVRPQLVLRGASTLSVGVHVSMLKRALRAVSFSLGGPSSSSSSSSSAVSLTSTLSDERMSDVVVPGAGAGELGWAILFHEVGRKIATFTADSAAHTSSKTPPLVGKSPTEALLQTFEERITPLVAFLSDLMVRRLVAVHADALCECAPLCELLASAYLQIPLQCIINSADVLPILNLSPHSSPSCGVGVSGGQPSAQQILLFWKEQFCRSGAATGRLGLVVNSDPLSDEICGFEDTVQRRVYTSANHFWNVFVTLLNCVKLRLRVGEVVPVKKRQNLKPLTAEEEDGEDVDAVVYSEW